MTTDYCFICREKHDKTDMYPLLFATDDKMENWELGYYCKECDSILGFLNKSNFGYEWDSWEDLNNSFNELLNRIEYNIFLIPYIKDTLKINLDNVKHHLNEIRKEFK